MSSARQLSGLFTEFRRRLDEEARLDPEPERRFSPRWHEWQVRSWRRERWRTELAESEALSSDAADPAPLASEGLDPFLGWARRQAERRRIPTSA